MLPTSAVRVWICWGLIAAGLAAGWWAHADTMSRFERVLGELDVEIPEFTRPPLPWMHAVAGGAAALLLGAAAATRRGRALLAPRPDPCERSTHGFLYLAATSGFLVLHGACLLAINAGALSGDWWLLPGALFLVFVFCFWRLRGARTPLREWGWTRGRGVLVELALGALVAIALRPLWHVFPLGLSGLGTPYLVYGILGAPILEQTLCRGLLYRDVRDRAGWIVAVVASAAVFALLHQPAARWPWLFVIGAVYGLLRHWRGSLLAPVGAHAAGNAMALL